VDAERVVAPIEDNVRRPPNFDGRAACRHGLSRGYVHRWSAHSGEVGSMLRQPLDCAVDRVRLGRRRGGGQERHTCWTPAFLRLLQQFQHPADLVVQGLEPNDLSGASLCLGRAPLAACGRWTTTGSGSNGSFRHSAAPPKRFERV
jgi:hypothetical protein